MWKDAWQNRILTKKSINGFHAMLSKYQNLTIQLEGFRKVLGLMRQDNIQLRLQKSESQSTRGDDHDHNIVQDHYKENCSRISSSVAMVLRSVCHASLLSTRTKPCKRNTEKSVCLSDIWARSCVASDFHFCVLQAAIEQKRFMSSGLTPKIGVCRP